MKIDKLQSINKEINNETINTNSFTEDQKKAYDELIKFIKSPFNTDFKRCLSGAAGTGKTYLVKSLIVNSGISNSTILLSAPTHKACRVLQESINIRGLKAETIQSILGLRLNFDVDNFDISNPPFDPMGKVKINNRSLCIVDESSMLNKDLLTYLERVAFKANCKILYIGDSSQLSPVRDKVSTVFRDNKTLYLNKIVRQGDDNPISNILQMLRKDITYKTFKTLEYLSLHKEELNESRTKGFVVCNPAEFDRFVYTQFTDEQFTKNIDLVKIVAYTNNCVSKWNAFIRNNIIKGFQTSVITINDLITSYVTLVDDFNDVIIRNSEEYVLKDIVNYTHPKYEIKGFMVKFVAIHGGRVSPPIFIVDHKDIQSITNYYKISNSLITEAKNAKNNRGNKWRDYYNFKNSCLLLTNITNSTGGIIMPRDLDYGFAITSHRSQGSTYETVCVDVNDMVFDKYGNPYKDCDGINRRLYVACSRAKNMLYLKYGV